MAELSIDVSYRNLATRFKDFKNAELIKAILKIYEAEINELINADLKLIADAKTLDLPDLARDLLDAHLLFLDAITKRVQQEIADLIKRKHEGFETECLAPECHEHECPDHKCVSRKAPAEEKQLKPLLESSLDDHGRDSDVDPLECY